jgi:hypothetical protein
MDNNLSSIFSFDTLSLKQSPNAPWAAIATAIIILLFAELGARLLLSPIGETGWRYHSVSVATKSEWYLREASRSAPAVLAIGDSTGVLGFHPPAFTAACGNLTSYNLSFLGNFPLALRSSTFPLIKVGVTAPKLVLLFQTVNGYGVDRILDNFEVQFLKSAAAKHFRGERSTADYFYLARLIPAAPLLRRIYISGLPWPAEPTERGFERPQPLRRTNNVVDASRSAESEHQLSERRLESIGDFYRLAEERHFIPLIVFPPRLATEGTSLVINAKSRINKIAVDHRQRVWDYSDWFKSDAARDSYFHDEVHLNETGAKLFSEELCRRIESGLGNLN